MNRRTFLLSTALTATAAAALGAQVATTTAPTQDPHAQMNHRGAQVMGFDQDKTSHHFYLYADGGAIEVSVKDAADTTNLTAIRAHLPHIVVMFSEGNFEAPMMVHGTTVPGTPEMKAVKGAITWKYEEQAKGGRVTITSADAGALKAIHTFLRYQITDHKTGDSLEITKR
jgi:hypothetical protein